MAHKSGLMSMAVVVFAMTLGACASQHGTQLSKTSVGSHAPQTVRTDPLSDRKSEVPRQQNANVITASDIGPRQVWGAADNVVQVKHLFISAQPDDDALARAKEEGVDVVINLREPVESSWDEAQAAAARGLTYYNVPVAREGDGFDLDVMERISDLAKQHRDEQILIHCSSGNRASAWFAIHLADDHGMPSSTAIERARLVSLTNATVEQRVRVYLAQSRVNGAR